jgi:hypothetical protein
MPVLRRGMRIILDKDGLAPRLRELPMAGSSETAKPNPDDLVEKVHDFLYHCLLAARKAARGELFVALQSVNCYLRRCLFDLIQIHANIFRGEPTAWYGARMIERRADKIAISGLAETCAQHDLASIGHAIDAAIELHASLANDIFDRLGLAYPAEAEARVRAMIEQLELTRPATRSSA